MILVDRRVGSADLHPLLKAAGFPSRITTLKYGDASFFGRGADDLPVPVGIERKRLSDLLSSITSRRLVGHQLPGLVSSYERVYLLVEGVYRPAADGLLEELRRGGWYPTRCRITYQQMEGFLITLRERSAIRVHRTSSARETALFLGHLFAWWQKPWSKHSAHLSLPEAADDRNPADPVLLCRPTLLRKMAAVLPGVGWRRSLLVAREFQSIAAMLSAPEAAWRGIQGIPPAIGSRVFRALHSKR